jgi:hypothetical protein
MNQEHDHLDISKTQQELHSLSIRRDQLNKKFEKIKRAKTAADAKFNSFYPYAAPSKYSTEIIWASIFIGFIFDFLLWESIFQGRFDFGSFSTAAARASAVVTSLAYAYVSSQLGIAAQLKVVAKNKQKTVKSNSIEWIVFNKHATRNSFSVWFILFTLLTVISVIGRFTTESGTTVDHTLLSLVSVAIALVITAMGYQYHDVYAHDLRKTQIEKTILEKQFDTYSSQLDDIDYKIKTMQWSIDNTTTDT